jgi:hypothetical protein
MICKKIDFYDEELEENVSGYMIIDEDEIVVIFKGYDKQGMKTFGNLEEIMQELIHLKELLSITEEMLDAEEKRADELEIILNDIKEI